MHAMKQIHCYYVSNGTMKVQVKEKSWPLSIAHATDFDMHFPGVDLAPAS